MATLNTTDVIACMFQDAVTITMNGGTYNLPANHPIGIPPSTTSITTDIATSAFCQLDTPDDHERRGLQVLFLNERRDVV